MNRSQEGPPGPTAREVHTPTLSRDVRGLRGGWATFQRHAYVDPAPDLAPFVAHYWIVDWDLRGQEPYRQRIVPYPLVHLSWINGIAAVHGVSRTPVFKVLEGAGRVFGVAFRPGCFQPFLRAPVSTLTDRSLPACEVLGSDVPERDIAAATGHAALVEIADRFLRAHLPERDPAAEAVADVVARIAAEPRILRVDELAGELGTNVRRLQRLFAEYVGVGPKWVIRRYRLHEVTERMAEGTTVNWAALAVELGYSDQAHLIRDLTAMVGETPTQYAQRYPSAPAPTSAAG